MQNLKIIAEEPQIKLSEMAVRNFGNLYKSYKKHPSQELKVQMLNLFKDQIELKAAAAAVNNPNISAVDYVQNLYLKFLKALNPAIKRGGYVVKSLTDTLNKTQPSKKDIIVSKHVQLEQISPSEEYDLFSYRIDDETLREKAEKIINYTKRNLSDIETTILSMFLDGKSFEEMAKECNISLYKTERIYDKAIKKLNNPKLKDKFNHILYEDVPPGSFKERIEDLPIETIKEILNSLIKEHGYIRQCLFSEKQNHNLLNRTGLILKIKLPERYNTDEFKTIAEQLSLQTYGRNVFQFLN